MIPVFKNRPTNMGEVKGAVMVVVIHGKKKVQKHFKNPALGRAFYEKAKQRFNNTYIHTCFDIIAPPNDFKPHGKSYWCPYCGRTRKFENHPIKDLACPICEISTRDFYVRSANGLWGVLSETKRRKKKNE